MWEHESAGDLGEGNMHFVACMRLSVEWKGWVTVKTDGTIDPASGLGSKCRPGLLHTVSQVELEFAARLSYQLLAPHLKQIF